MSESAQNQLVNAIRSLQTALEQHDAAVSASCALGRSDWRCLDWLVEEGPRSPRTIRRRLGLTSGSVTALLDRLERRGLIVRRADPVDRRGLSIEASAEAHQLVRDANVSLDHVMGKLSARWGAARSASTRQACLDLAKLIEWAAQRA
ncbi:MAG: MarR family transcriptional regulator [Pseudomonadota bacterium]